MARLYRSNERVWLDEATICIVEKDVAVSPDHVNGKLALQPIFNVLCGSGGKENSESRHTNIFADEVRVVEKLTHGHSDIFTLCRAFRFDQIAAINFKGVASQLSVFCDV